MIDALTLGSEASAVFLIAILHAKASIPNLDCQPVRHTETRTQVPELHYAIEPRSKQLLVVG
jgi:hypothetical protein